VAVLRLYCLIADDLHSLYRDGTTVPRINATTVTNTTIMPGHTRTNNNVVPASFCYYSCEIHLFLPMAAICAILLFLPMKGTPMMLMLWDLFLLAKRRNNNVAAAAATAASYYCYYCEILLFLPTDETAC
jgi:hypothetical protein